MRNSAHRLHHLRRAIGRNVYRYRSEKALSHAELACLTGIPARRLKQYELGTRRIDIEDMFRIADALNMQTWKFIGGISTRNL